MKFYLTCLVRMFAILIDLLLVQEICLFLSSGELVCRQLDKRFLINRRQLTLQLVISFPSTFDFRSLMNITLVSLDVHQKIEKKEKEEEERKEELVFEFSSATYCCTLTDKDASVTS